MKINENWLDEETGKYKCPECGRLYSKNGICSHFIVAHTEEGKERHLKSLQKRHLNQTGKPSWNSGLTKNTDSRIKSQGERYSKNYKEGKYKKSYFSSFHELNHERSLEAKRKGGIKSAISQNKRSKNEKLFCEMCESYFKDVKHNEPIFNGWDADIIIEDIRYAVLWNGIWHYQKITDNQNLPYVQSRDKIKLLEIEKKGYKAYVIQDMGSYDPIFVKEEFDKFLKILGY